MLSDNAFARVLQAYEDHKRSKLTADDLRKASAVPSAAFGLVDEWGCGANGRGNGDNDDVWQIAGKYKGKGAKLVADFGRKYGVGVPRAVLVAEIRRLLSVYDVPSEYAQLLPSEDELAAVEEYDARLDPRNATFDATEALRAKRLCTPFPDAAPVDNIYMARHLLPGESMSAAAQRRLQVRTIEEPVVPEQSFKQQAPAVLERIADSLRDSPYELLWRYFHDQTRIKVLIRNVNSLRGTCEGYLKAFDKHMNLLMTDVKEVYTPTSSGDRGKRPNQQNPTKTMKRFLKQLLIRGDNIVLICRAQQHQQPGGSRGDVAVADSSSKTG